MSTTNRIHDYIDSGNNGSQLIENTSNLITAEVLREALKHLSDIYPVGLGFSNYDEKGEPVLNNLGISQYVAKDSNTTHMQNTASGEYSSAFGLSTKASGDYSNTIGLETKATGHNSHAEGFRTIAGGISSHAEGNTTTSSGDSSHAEGFKTIASAPHSHAEGYKSKAEGYGSHAEGGYLFENNDLPGGNAKAYASHAEGINTLSHGPASHSEGIGTIAINAAEHASGKYNISENGTIFSVGTGTSDNDRKNAVDIRNQSGNDYLTTVYTDLNITNGKIVKIGDPQKYSGDNINIDNTKLRVAGGIYIDGDLITTGTHTIVDVQTDTAEELHVKGQTQLDGNTTINSSADINGGLTVAGTTELNGDTIIDAALKVNAKTTIDDDLEVNGTITLNSTTTIDDTLNVTDKTTLNETIINKDLEICGTAKIKNNTLELLLPLRDDLVNDQPINLGNNEVLKGNNVFAPTFGQINSMQSQNVIINPTLDVSGISLTDSLIVSSSIQAGNATRGVYAANWAFTGPVNNTQIPNSYTYEVPESLGNYQKFLENLINISNRNSQIYADYNISLRVIGCNITKNTITFNEPIYFTINANGEKVAKNITNLYFPIGYFISVNRESSSKSNKSSVAINASTANGLLSSSSNYSNAFAPYSSAEGTGGESLKASRFYQCIPTEDSDGEGFTGAYGIGSHIEGNLTISTIAASYGHAEGHSTVSNSFAAHAEGTRTLSSGQSSHAEGESSVAFGDYSHAEGYGRNEFHTISEELDFDPEKIKTYWETNKNINVAVGVASHTEGVNTFAYGAGAHAEGSQTNATGMYSHSEGYKSTTTGKYAHSEGHLTTASGDHSHAEGYLTQATKANTHTEGRETQAIKQNAHAEGYKTIASGDHSHAEGHTTTASGTCSHSGGSSSTAVGNNSFAHGNNVNAQNTCEVAFGKYNVSTKDSTIFSVGNGTSTNPKNAFEIRLEDSKATAYIDNDKKLLTNEDKEELIEKINDIHLSEINSEYFKIITEENASSGDELGITMNYGSAFIGLHDDGLFLGNYTAGFALDAVNIGCTSDLDLRGNNIVNAGNVLELSDERLKTFKGEIPVDFDKLKLLRKAYFSFNRTLDKNELGVSAQEIQAVYPEIVHEDSNGYLSVDYGKLSVIALKAIDILDDRLSRIEKHLGL